MSAVWRSSACEAAVIGKSGGWAVDLEGKATQTVEMASLHAGAENEERCDEGEPKA